HLIELSHGPQQSDSGIGMGAEANQNFFWRPVHAPGQCGESRNRQIAGQIEGPEVAMLLLAQTLRELDKIRFVETIQVDAGPANAVVPPERDSVTLDELKKALEDRLLERVPGRVAVGASTAVAPFHRVAVITKSGGEIAN